MEYTQIKCELIDRVLTITLNRPDRLNAFTTTMGNELIDAFKKADADDNVRAIIVTGAGRAFCAGADLNPEDKDEVSLSKGSLSEPEDVVFRYGLPGMISITLFNLKKPVIGAINGSAVGAGLTITLAMDFRIIADNAKLGFPFTRRGLTAEGASGWFLPRIAGIGKALDWVLTGRLFDAHEALTYRLATEVLPQEAILSRAREIALDIAQNTSAISVALNRQLLWRMMGADHPSEAVSIDARATFWAFQQPDASEGIKSFLEKRQPNFLMKPSTDMPYFYPWWIEKPIK
jgi:enoyl-CoA hydratase/carnithine racemase